MRAKKSPSGETLEDQALRPSRATPLKTKAAKSSSARAKVSKLKTAPKKRAIATQESHDKPASKRTRTRKQTAAAPEVLETSAQTENDRKQAGLKTRFANPVLL